jgi:hypothetical protein
MTDETDTAEAQQFWEDFYRQHEHAGSGKANPVLVDVVGSLPAATAPCPTPRRASLPPKRS